MGARAAGLRKTLSIEIDADASSTIRRNFPGIPHLETPIERVSEETLSAVLGTSPVNVVFAGPPVRAFLWQGTASAAIPEISCSGNA